jgi:DNA-binding GntR family transcriptional regulator
MKLERPLSLKEMVVGELRERIIDNRIKLGAPLSENALAADLGLSKTPVREALQQLRLEGLVEVLPQKGTYVVRLGAQDVIQICDLRKVLERAIAPLAIENDYEGLVEAVADIVAQMQIAYESNDVLTYQKLDGQFHLAFIDRCGNSYMRDAYNQIGFRIQALRSRLCYLQDLNARSIAQHKEILEASRSRNIHLLLEILDIHIEETKLAYLEVLQGSENELT